jgi:hypothetical protein
MPDSLETTLHLLQHDDEKFVRKGLDSLDSLDDELLESLYELAHEGFVDGLELGLFEGAPHGLLVSLGLSQHTGLDFKAVEHLGIQESESLQTLTGIGQLENLSDLTISRSHALKDVDELAELRTLDSLVLYDCECVESLHSLGRLTQLKSLCLRYCTSAPIESEWLSRLTNLKVLDLSYCNPSVGNATDFFLGMTQLKTLILVGCSVGLDGISQLLALENLNLSGVQALPEAHPELENLQRRVAEGTLDLILPAERDEDGNYIESYYFEM